MWDSFYVGLFCRDWIYVGLLCVCVWGDWIYVGFNLCGMNLCKIEFMWNLIYVGLILCEIVFCVGLILIKIILCRYHCLSTLILYCVLIPRMWLLKEATDPNNSNINSEHEKLSPNPEYPGKKNDIDNSTPK